MGYYRPTNEIVFKVINFEETYEELQKIGYRFKNIHLETFKFSLDNDHWVLREDTKQVLVYSKEILAYGSLHKTTLLEILLEHKYDKGN